MLSSSSSHPPAADTDPRLRQSPRQTLRPPLKPVASMASKFLDIIRSIREAGLPVMSLQAEARLQNLLRDVTLPRCEFPRNAWGHVTKPMNLVENYTVVLEAIAEHEQRQVRLGLKQAHHLP